MTDNELWYDKAASVWTEALPVGNGRLGAMVFGDAWNERLQINESTFWSGGPYQPINPDARAALPEVRNLILAGQYPEADRKAYEGAMAKPYRQASYQPIGDVWLDLHHDIAVTNYRRSLDLETAVAVTQYDCHGIHFRRDVFASAIHDVIVCRIAVNQPGALSMTIMLSSPQNGDPTEVTDATLGYDGRNRRQNGIDGALRFAFRVRVVADGGFVDINEDTIRVREANSVMLLIDAGTSFQTYKTVDGDPQAQVKARLDAAAKLAYEDLLDAHIGEHRRLFDRMQIAIGDKPAPTLPTDQRVAAYADGDDPSLAALYLQYGRYLAISCSRPGTQAANLQGIWNEDIHPAWGSRYTVNINLEMNYWLADVANLSETFLPLIELLEGVAETGREMASAHYGARGWVLHHNTDIWCATGPIDGPHWGLWPMGGAWLCAQLYDHYRFNPDDAVLERVYPLIKGAVEFALDTLVALPGSNYLGTCPSLSPENSHPFGSSLCAAPAMDNQILRDLFEAFTQASTTLGRDAELRDQAVAARARLPEDRIGKGGQLQEWMEDWDLDAPEQQHRHVSHLYAVYPSLQIDPLQQPDFAKAAEVVLERRGDDATGWGIGWRLNLWARLGNGNRAAQVLAKLLTPERTYPNLMDAHPPFQIDGNFGGAAGIVEMLVQSRPRELRLLAALPESWASGSLKGVRTRGGHTVDLDWQGGVLSQLRVIAGHAGPLTIRHPSGVVEVQLREGEAWESR